MHREEDEQRQAAVTRNEKQCVNCAQTQQVLRLALTQLRSYLLLQLLTS